MFQIFVSSQGRQTDTKITLSPESWPKNTPYARKVSNFSACKLLAFHLFTSILLYKFWIFLGLFFINCNWVFVISKGLMKIRSWIHMYRLTMKAIAGSLSLSFPRWRPLVLLPSSFCNYSFFRSYSLTLYPLFLF